MEADQGGMTQFKANKKTASGWEARRQPSEFWTLPAGYL
jgi:hypothetical protein